MGLPEAAEAAEVRPGQTEAATAEAAGMFVQARVAAAATDPEAADLSAAGSLSSSETAANQEWAARLE